MARIRTIKPEFFRHEDLYEAEQACGLPLRIAFAGLFTVADREGRFKWQPRVLKLDVMPFDEVDFGEVLTQLAARGFIVKYQVGENTYGNIPSWAKHQHINQREPASDIPSPDEDGARTCENIPARVEGKGREEEGKGERVVDAHTRQPSSKDAKKGTRLPSDWSPSESNLTFARSKGVPEDALSREADKFRDHWIAKPGKDGVKLDWDAAWRTWVNRVCEWKGWAPVAPANGSTTGFVWVLRDSDEWAPLAEQWKRSHGGRDPPTKGGQGGTGWYFPVEPAPLSG